MNCVMPSIRQVTLTTLHLALQCPTLKVRPEKLNVTMQIAPYNMQTRRQSLKTTK